MADKPRVALRALLFDVQGTATDFHSTVQAEATRISAGRHGDVNWSRFADRWRAEYRTALESATRDQGNWTSVRSIVLPYHQLFGPNVVGTAELIRLAITTRVKPVTYLSTIAVAMTVPPGQFEEDGDIRRVSPTRPINDDYVNGYANSKWAGEVLLREANDLCGVPVAVFRSDMILAHTRYRGQLNVPDMFTRLIFSLLVTGIAPHSFYESDGMGSRARAHYDGLPVDFIAEAITTIGARVTDGYRSFDVMNPYDDGVSLDVFVDWLIRAGNKIQRIDDYDEWLARFQTALTGLPERQRQHSVLPLLHAFRKPEKPVRGAAAPTDVFHAEVRAAKVGPDKGHPAHLSGADRQVRRRPTSAGPAQREPGAGARQGHGERSRSQS